MLVGRNVCTASLTLCLYFLLAVMTPYCRLEGLTLTFVAVNVGTLFSSEMTTTVSEQSIML